VRKKTTQQTPSNSYIIVTCYITVVLNNNYIAEWEIITNNYIIVTWCFAEDGSSIDISYKAFRTIYTNGLSLKIG